MTLLILFCFAWCYTYSFIPLIKHILRTKVGFSGGSDGKESACNVEDPSLIPGSERSPGEENGNPFQYSCLDNSMDMGAWWATVHGVTNSCSVVSEQLRHTHTRTKVCTLGQMLSCRFLKYQFQRPHLLLIIILFHKSFGTVSAGCCGTDHKGDTADPSDLGRLPGGIDL